MVFSRVRMGEDLTVISVSANSPRDHVANQHKDKKHGYRQGHQGQNENIARNIAEKTQGHGRTSRKTDCKVHTPLQ
jgi:hypothetical protein